MFDKSVTVWIIDDDEINRAHFTLLFLEDRPDIKVLSFECLFDAFQCNKRADYIFIDLSAVNGRVLPCFNNHSYIRNLQNFVEKYRSAFIIIMGALISHAEEDVDDLKEVCSDTMLFALDNCDPMTSNALVDFVNRYSPE